MKSDISQPVATGHFVLITANGARRAVTAVIGMPYVVDSAEARCPARLDGIDGQYPDQCGSDTFQALSLALRLVHMRLVHQLESGHVLCDADGKEMDRASLDLMFARSDAGDHHIAGVVAEADDVLVLAGADR